MSGHPPKKTKNVGSNVSNHNNQDVVVYDMMNSSQSISKVMNAQSSEEIRKNRLLLHTSILVARWLAMQGCTFGGLDEYDSSSNRGNFIELLYELATVNGEIADSIENAPKNGKYTSPMVQEELLNIMANKVRQIIREEVGDGYFCILVDGEEDEVKRDHMAIVLRFVNSDGVLLERFFDIISVENTTAATFKKEISRSLLHYNFQLHNMRGQGYDGGSYMREVWNELQGLFLKEYPSAYYIHCFAHQLQLTLVSVAKDMFSVAQFFSYLTAIVNVVASSPKQLFVLQSAQREEVSFRIEIGKCESGSGLNQIETKHRPGETRWSSCYQTVRDLFNMYATTCKVLLDLAETEQPETIRRGEADGLYSIATTFDFVFHLHLMDSILGVVELLCQSCNDQNIFMAVRLASTTKTLLNQLQEDGWDTFIYEVKLFCERNEVDIPDMSQPYTVGRFGRRDQQITTEHYYHFEVFNQVINSQLMELNTRFNDSTLELLTLSQALNPNDSFSSFNVEDICKLATKFYPQDFCDQDIHALKIELQHYQLDVTTDAELRRISLLSDLSTALVRTKRADIYSLVFRLIRLVLTLPVSTATTERAFSAMKHFKTTIRNEMEDEFLTNSMILFIERELSSNLDLDSVINDFECIEKDN